MKRGGLCRGITRWSTCRGAAPWAYARRACGNSNAQLGRAGERLKWIALALLIANEVRGIVVVAAVAPPIFRAMFG